MKSSFILTFLTALFWNSFPLHAQDKWEYLPNVGLDSSTNIRFEDVYFTTYHTGFAVDLSYKIHKTTDGGQTWRKVADGTTGVSGGRSIEFLQDGKTGIAGAFSAKIARTDDSGESWQDITAAVPDTATDFPRHGICGISHIHNSFFAVGIYASKTAHFYRSDDRGITWTTKYIDTGLVNGLVDVIFTSADTGFICGVKRYLGKGEFGVVLKTTDGGNTWRKVFEAPGWYQEYIWKLQFIGTQFGVGAIQSNDTIAMIKTTDGGENWKVLGTGFKPSDFSYSSPSPHVTQSIGFVTPLKGWMGGYFGSIVETNDGGITWDSLSFGRNFNRIFVIDSEHAYAGGKSVYRYGSKFKLGLPRNEGPADIPHTLYPISPNPATGKIKIEFDLKTTTNVNVQVFQAGSGRVWDVHRARLNPGHYIYFWEDATAAAGNYFVRLNNDEIPLIQKFVLTK
ncbi:MAG: hypothetical protein WC716_12735 [Chitinophagaceae bacterium]|jgi:photosystem II stability/assembly factor-like uncharacterized protein